MSVTTNATNDFGSLQRALSGADRTYYREAYKQILEVRSLDPKYMDDGKTGARDLARQDLIQEATNEVTSQVETVATRMKLPDGSLPSEFKIEVKEVKLKLPRAFPRDGIRGASNYGTGTARELSVVATVTAQGSTRGHGSSRQTVQEDFKGGVVQKDGVWVPVEQTVNDGALASLASQSNASRAA